MSANSLYIKPGTPPSTNQPIKIEGVVGGTITVFPTGATSATGITDASDTITCADFENAIVDLFIGGIPIPQIDPGTPDMFFTKGYASTELNFTNGNLTDGDLIKIIIYK